MIPQIVINYSEVTEAARNRIAVAAKRTRAKDGSTLFAIVMPSTPEDVILKGMAMASALKAVTSILSLVQGIDTQDIDGIQFRIKNLRWRTTSDDSFGNLVTNALKNYVEADAAAQYISHSAPSVAQPYLAEADVALNTLKELVFFKDEPTQSAKNPEDITATVSEA